MVGEGRGLRTEARVDRRSGKRWVQRLGQGRDRLGPGQGSRHAGGPESDDPATMASCRSKDSREESSPAKLAPPLGPPG